MDHDSEVLPCYLHTLSVSWITFCHSGNPDIVGLPAHDGHEPTCSAVEDVDGRGIGDGEWGFHHGTALQAYTVSFLEHS